MATLYRGAKKGLWANTKTLTEYTRKPSSTSNLGSDDRYFDSQFEWSVYKSLKKTVSENIIIKPEFILFEKQENFAPKFSWRTDFYLQEFSVYVEAKGVPDSAFLNLLKALSFIHPDTYAWQLVIVLPFYGNHSWTKKFPACHFCRVHEKNDFFYNLQNKEKYPWESLRHQEMMESTTNYF